MSIENIIKKLSDKYEFIRLIGKGGFAEVYLAKDKMLEREVAIKILLSRHAGDDEIIERFIREAKLYAKFEHKNLIPIYETGIIDDNAYIVMKFVNGESLKKISDRDGKVDPELSIEIVKGMASALNYIHKQGIIHRDIKPANIIIEKETNRVYLADFGIARPISSQTLTKTGMLIGTPYYISPEQIKSGKADKRSDIYALGTTMYEAISGTPVFQCETPIEVLYKHVNEKPKPIASINSDITMEMKFIVEKCLEKEPSKRFQNANEIIEVLEKAETSQFELPDEHEVSKPSFFKRRLFKVLSLVFILSGIVFAVYHFYPDLFQKSLAEKDPGTLSDLKKSNSENSSENNPDGQIDKPDPKQGDTSNLDPNQKGSEIVDPTQKSEENNSSEKTAENENGTPEIKPELTQEDVNYQIYFDKAKKALKDKAFNKSKSYIEKAKSYKKTVEIYELNEELNRQLSLHKKQNKQLETKPDKQLSPSSVKKPKISKVSLFKLSSDLMKVYLKKMRIIRTSLDPKKKANMFFINNGVLSGQLTLKIRVNEFGKISIMNINSDNLLVKPSILKARTVRRILNLIMNQQLDPPLDKNGNKVILENWRITYIVSKFKNRIILKRRI